MQRLVLDYQQSGAAATKTGTALLLIGLTATLLISLQFRSVKLELAAAEENAGHLQQQLSHGKVSSSPSRSSAEIQQEVRFANDILMQLTLPWASLFKTLESSNTDQIALLSIQPDSGKHSVKVSGEAKDFGALLDYIQQLEQDKTMTEVTLLSHEINQQAPEKPVRFVLTANWSSQP